MLCIILNAKISLIKHQRKRSGFPQSGFAWTKLERCGKHKGRPICQHSGADPHPGPLEFIQAFIHSNTEGPGVCPEAQGVRAPGGNFPGALPSPGTLFSSTSAPFTACIGVVLAGFLEHVIH